MNIFQLYFLKIIFKNAKDEDVTKRFILFDKSTTISIFIFDDYYYQKKKFELYFFYNYIKVIFSIKYSTR